MRLIDADKLKAHYSWWKDATGEMTMGEAKDIFDEIVALQQTVDAVPKGAVFHIETFDEMHETYTEEELTLEEMLDKYTDEGYPYMEVEEDNE